jgi:asparagine synthase (glutamine-hydrolysing)
MCGIAGIIGNNENREQVMPMMMHAQRHRGPDAQCTWKDENIILGHNRLSIIDLHESANQPMHSTCGRYVIVFNGEIYNYKELALQLSSEYTFHTRSDTEVILAAYVKWGKNMLDGLNGMFAFGIWDKEKKALFAARDRFGVKPFYYSISQNNFYFSSEIKTLWAAEIPKEKNLHVWSKYLAFGSYGLPLETFWKNILQLPAGHYLEVDTATEGVLDSTVQPTLWYNFAERIKKTPEFEINELKEKYLYLLKNSIRYRFISDVPVGFNISGGLDSSTLLALINQVFPDNKSIEAFTFYTGHPEYDELQWVEQMITLTGNPLNKCLLTIETIPELIEKVSYYQDEPFGGFPTLAYSLIFKKANEKGIIVLLDGQGMDEAWAGYDYYQTNTGFTLQGAKTSPVKPEILDKEFLAIGENEIIPSPFDNNLQNLQYRDLFYTKIPRALRFNDRVSMMHSTELREPFLDYRLVELAFAQKDKVKIQNGQAKWLLRQLVKDLLGEQVALAPKRALQTPQREWIANELNGYAAEKIKHFSKLDFVDAKKVNAVWNNYLAGNNDNSFFIWQWINLATIQDSTPDL